MNPQKYNEVIENVVKECTEEMVALMRKNNAISVILDEETAPSILIEKDSENGISCFYDKVVSMNLSVNDTILVYTKTQTIPGVLDGNNGIYAADCIGPLYQSLVDYFNSKKKYLLSEDESKKVCDLIGFAFCDIDYDYVLDENEHFVLICIVMGDMYDRTEVTVLRDKESKEILVPTNGNFPHTLELATFTTLHPLTLTTLYPLNEETESEEKTEIILSDKFEKVTMDKNLSDKLNYLKNCGISDEKGTIFADNKISFVWLKNHTLCVKSPYRTNKSYIAVYKHRNDIVPSKFYEETKVDFTFPANE